MTMRVSTLPDQLTERAWPELAVGLTAVPTPVDTLVLCAGFEDRSAAVLRRAVLAGARGFNVICLDYLPAVAENRREEVIQLCRDADARHELVVYDRESPAGAAERLFDAVKGSGNIHLDISGMSRLLIVQAVVFALREALASRTQIWYAEAEQYPPTRAQVEKELAEAADPLAVAMFLSTGVFGVTVVPELSSVAMQGQPIRLIAWPSWNAMQVAALCGELQASSYTMLHGQPPRAENDWRLDAIKSLNHIGALASLEERTTSTLDYRETLSTLLELYRLHAQREKLVLAPTGSKMQSVAVGIMRAWFHDVQVVYPTPKTFTAPSEYTRGVREFYSLPLAAFEPPHPGHGNAGDSDDD